MREIKKRSESVTEGVRETERERETETGLTISRISGFRDPMDWEGASSSEVRQAVGKDAPEFSVRRAQGRLRPGFLVAVQVVGFRVEGLGCFRCRFVVWVVVKIMVPFTTAPII